MKNGPKFDKVNEDFIKKMIALFESASINYNKNSEEAYIFFKIVQNKLHDAINKRVYNICIQSNN